MVCASCMCLPLESRKSVTRSVQVLGDVTRLNVANVVIVVVYRADLEICDCRYFC